jgi:hypothetical protein
MQLNIKWFTSIDSFDALKTHYKELVKQYHPDLNSDNLESMKEINAEYDFLLNNLAKLTDKPIDLEAESEFKEIILALVKLDLEVEVCGSWLWLHGDTKPIKDDLKELGCYWASKKKLWYWKPEGSRTFSKGSFSMSEIRAKYGSNYVQSKNKRLLRA